MGLKEYLNVDGQAGRELYKHRKIITMLIVICNMILLFFLIQQLILNWFSYTYFIIILSWILWNLLAIKTIAYDNINDFLLVLLTLPLVGFGLIVIIPFIAYLKTKYPNSDEPDEILKFERKRKLKTFL